MDTVIAVVDDEPDILELVALHLRKAGFSVRSYAAAAPFLASLGTARPDLVLLDLMLPDADGFDVYRHLRSNAGTAAVPVIMLTARGEEVDRILGLELGADDYVVKPFSPKELVARVRAVLRRRTPPGHPAPAISVGGILHIDPEKHAVAVAGEPVELTATEFRILLILAEKPGWVFPREKILDRLWGQEKAVTDRTVDVHIKHIRGKLGPAARFVRNVRGVGYKVEP